MCGFSFFVHGSAPEVSLMESRNFVAAREMVAGGSWLIPTMNHELRLAKPPLPTWAVAAVQLVSSPTENLGILRLPAALMATLLVLFFWGLVKELVANRAAELDAPGRTAWLSALVLASSLLVITTGREGQWDIFANSFLVGALWLLVRGWRSAGSAYASFVGAGLLLGLSILSKGPVALYGGLLPFLGCYASRLNEERAGLPSHKRGALLAALVALAVGGAWPLYILYHVQPAALAVAQTEVTAWRERHVQPLWYYWNFFAFSGVWVVAALAGLAAPYARRRLTPFLPYVFVLGWLVFSLVLLSLVPEKKERYMLPLLPPLALLATGALRYWETAFARQQATHTDRRLLRFWAGVFTLACLAAPAAMIGARLPGFGPTTLRFGATVVVCGGLTLLAIRGGWQQRPAVLMLGSFTLLATLITVLLPAYPHWEARHGEPGLRRLRDARHQPAIQGLPWYSLKELHVKQVWAAGRAVPLLPKMAAAWKLPAALFADTSDITGAPALKRRRVRIERVDSFFLGRERKNGKWFIFLLKPKR
ncbi:ArnT family glycosyltransferase [Hymenobacter cavernae]|uniref:ArnT family glycosyltransferase n=1 Tax=Hymenobacter cavernae TaxID=2044852 RepID=UPI001E511C28|nr:glycosyltransferase family 39 protein [Hymenobacter cavernae]